MSKRIDALLEPFFGYMHLKMHDEANDVLENLPNDFKNSPTVLLAQLDLIMEMKMWEEGVLLGESLCGLWSAELEFWFRTAYCQHELRRTLEAKQTLLGAPPGIRDTATFNYNLTCYETQLGDLKEGKRLLGISIGEDKAFRKEALDDPDLEPLWASLGKS